MLALALSMRSCDRLRKVSAQLDFTSFVVRICVISVRIYDFICLIALILHCVRGKEDPLTLVFLLKLFEQVALLAQFFRPLIS
jgi:hypothetical protein